MYDITSSLSVYGFFSTKHLSGSSKPVIQSPTGVVSAHPNAPNLE